MQTMEFDVVVVGGGAAGMAAALAAVEQGAKTALLEAEPFLGGVLPQCIHAGFGIHTFSEELTGPEYAKRFADAVAASEIAVFCETFATDLSPNRKVSALAADGSQVVFDAKAVVLACGCKERPAGAIALPGQRPAGVITAGTAQRLINCEGYMVGRKVLILGSGDIGLIMARRLTLEGDAVVAVCERMPYAGGLARNVAQCLEDFDIPLWLSTTAVYVEGTNRVTGVWVAPVDENGKTETEKKRLIPCDTLLLSVGLIPETALAESANLALSPHKGIAVDQNRRAKEGIFACGNVVQVQDLVDAAAKEGSLAGLAAGKFALGKGETAEKTLSVSAGSGIGQVSPRNISLPAEGEISLSFRCAKPLRKAVFVCTQNGNVLAKLRKSIARPGEMENVSFPASVLQSEGEILLEVEP